MRSKSWIVVSILLLAACTTTAPIRYYTLDMSPSGHTPVTANLQIEGIRTSEALSRSQIQIQTSPTRIDYYAAHEWAGGIGELVARKLAAEFAAAQSDGPDLTLSGTLLDCTQVDIPNRSEDEPRRRDSGRSKPSLRTTRPHKDLHSEPPRLAKQPRRGGRSAVTLRRNHRRRDRRGSLETLKPAAAAKDARSESCGPRTRGSIGSRSCQWSALFASAVS